MDFGISILKGLKIAKTLLAIKSCGISNILIEELIKYGINEVLDSDVLSDLGLDNDKIEEIKEKLEEFSQLFS